MLTIDDIRTLAAENGLRITEHKTAEFSPESMTVWFAGERTCAHAWRTLMTDLTEIPIRLIGTRLTTGSGSTDGRLYPCYSALLGDINAIRTKLGLGQVLN